MLAQAVGGQYTRMSASGTIVNDSDLPAGSARGTSLLVVFFDRDGKLLGSVGGGTTEMVPPHERRPFTALSAGSVPPWDQEAIASAKVVVWTFTTQ